MYPCAVYFTFAALEHVKAVQQAWDISAPTGVC